MKLKCSGTTSFMKHTAFKTLKLPRQNFVEFGWKGVLHLQELSGPRDVDEIGPISVAVIDRRHFLHFTVDGGGCLGAGAACATLDLVLTVGFVMVVSYVS